MNYHLIPFGKDLKSFASPSQMESGLDFTSFQASSKETSQLMDGTME